MCRLYKILLVRNVGGGKNEVGRIEFSFQNLVKGFGLLIVVVRKS